MLDAYVAACVSIAVTSGVAAEPDGRAHERRASAEESWALLRVDSSRLETLRQSQPPSPQVN